MAAHVTQQRLDLQWYVNVSNEDRRRLQINHARKPAVHARGDACVLISYGQPEQANTNTKSEEMKKDLWSAAPSCHLVLRHGYPLNQTK
jgi:hypothetical protein